MATDCEAALAAALADIAGICEVDGRTLVLGECANFGGSCIDLSPSEPDEWCPVCVAEVAWSAWKMGVLA